MPIEVTDADIVTSTRFVILAKVLVVSTIAPYPSTCIVVEDCIHPIIVAVVPELFRVWVDVPTNVMSVMAVLANALAPRLVTLDGKLTVARLLQPEKASVPIDITDADIVTPTRFAILANV